MASVIATTETMKNSSARRQGCTPPITAGARVLQLEFPVMTHEHTPGPWQAIRAEYGQRREQYRPWTIETTENERYTRIGMLTDRWDERAKADARLIAAAPELFDACKDALGFGDEQGLSRVVRPGVTLEQALRTAIAAVNGGVS